MWEPLFCSCFSWSCMLLHSSCWVSQIPSLLRYIHAVSHSLTWLTTVSLVSCVSCCVLCVELIVSSLYCLHSVYAILILSIPICKNVLSFVSSLWEEPRGHGLHYRVLLGQASLSLYCILHAVSGVSVSCVSLQPLEIVQRS